MPRSFSTAECGFLPRKYRSLAGHRAYSGLPVQVLAFTDERNARATPGDKENRP